ncbi:MAG: hypothetical protein ACK456_16750 [Pseudanabaenaceae cyanobacterium]|jgi:hypothetical protein
MNNINPDFPLLCGLYVFSGGAQFIVAMFLLTVVQPQQQEANLPPQQKKDVRALAYGFLVAGSVIFLFFALLLLYGQTLSTFTTEILLLSVLLVMVPIQVVLGFLTLQRKSLPLAEPTEVPTSSVYSSVNPEPVALVELTAEVVPVHGLGITPSWTNHLDSSLLAEMAEAGIIEEPGVILNEAIRLWLRRRALEKNGDNQEVWLRNERQSRYWQRYQGND